MGAVRYPRRRFLAFDALAAGSWGLYSALVGYVGGLAFEQDPLRGLLLGLGLALTVTVVVEVVRWLRNRRRTAGPASRAPTPFPPGPSVGRRTPGLAEQELAGAHPDHVHQPGRGLLRIRLGVVASQSASDSLAPTRA